VNGKKEPLYFLDDSDRVLVRVLLPDGTTVGKKGERKDLTIDAEAIATGEASQYVCRASHAKIYSGPLPHPWPVYESQRVRGKIEVILT
jgi:hypothetical protein